jgi:ADP-ribose pyrophosphatase
MAKATKHEPISSEVRLDDGFLRITFDRAIDPDGHVLGRDIVHHDGSAVILPVNEAGEVLLERIFRLPVPGYLWELPAGRIDPGETALQAAKRELAEETGLKAKRWRKLVEFYASPGFLAEKMTIYVASELAHGTAEASDDEHMELRWFGRAELERWLGKGRFCDAKTLLGLQMWLAETRTAASKRRRGG